MVYGRLGNVECIDTFNYVRSTPLEEEEEEEEPLLTTFGCFDLSGEVVVKYWQE